MSSTLYPPPWQQPNAGGSPGNSNNGYPAPPRSGGAPASNMMPTTTTAYGAAGGNSLFSGGAADSAAMQGAWMAANMGAAVGGQYLQEINSGLQAYLQKTNLKYYFTLSNYYVLQKLRLVLLPVSKRGRWERKRVHRDGELYYETPRDDVFAPDLYIPLMALVTHVLLVGLGAGLNGDFHPEMLGMVASANLVSLVLEMILLKACLYFLGISTIPLIELFAYTAYVFVGIVFSEIVGLLAGTLAFYISLVLCGLFMAIFLVRTLRPNIKDLRLVADNYVQSVPDSKHNYFILGAGLLQIFMAFVIGVVFSYSAFPSSSKLSESIPSSLPITPNQ